MEALWILIPLSVAAVLGIVWLLWVATEGGQFDDLTGPAMQVVMDDDRPLRGTRGGRDGWPGYEVSTETTETTETTEETRHFPTRATSLDSSN